MDALSQALNAVRVTGAIFFNADNQAGPGSGGDPFIVESLEIDQFDLVP